MDSYLDRWKDLFLLQEEEDHYDESIVGQNGFSAVLFIAGTRQLVVIGPVLDDHTEGPDAWVGRETEADKLSVENSHTVLKYSSQNKL